jgi:HemY protein
MVRIILFLLVVAIAAFAATRVGDQSGDIVVTWSGWRIETTLPVFALGVFLVAVAAVVIWSIVRGLWRVPHRVRKRRHERRAARGRQAITHGLLAIGHGDSAAARRHAATARRLATHDPLALLLHAQSAQLDGDRHGAQQAFRAMAERKDTRLLGLRGLFIEAQRADDPFAAIQIAEEALKLAPASTWASQAVLGFRCARGDWSGALAILDSNLAAGLIGKTLYQRHRAVLLTARALELETSDRDRSRDSVTEAVRLAPSLVPAAVLAAKFLSESQQVRRAMRIIETAWTANPHPDLAEAYAHVRLGDSAQQRLARVEALAARAPGDLESALAVARAAIDASEFTRARAALAPFLDAPTQRVAMLMAEIERTEHGDRGRAREWTLRAVRARHDPVWTADGYVSDRWRPVSPVTGQLDAFRWQTPVAALPSDAAPVVVSDAAGASSPPGIAPPEAHAASVQAPPAAVEAMPGADADRGPPPTAAPVRAPPLFRPRTHDDEPKAGATAAPAVPPLVPIQTIRPPDDPGVDDDFAGDEFDREGVPPTAQAGGWRGFLSRLGR